MVTLNAVNNYFFAALFSKMPPRNFLEGQSGHVGAGSDSCTPKVPINRISKSMLKTNDFALTFLNIASQGLSDGQDGQVGAGDSSHVDPDGLD